jgi:CRP/FNR family transcriptional regulator, cyclic AMP receptor protein
MRAGSIPVPGRGLQTREMYAIPTNRRGVMGFWDHASPADWAAVLATFPLFADVAERRLRALARHATFAEYGAGDVVIEQGAPGDALYVILSGSARARGRPAARKLGVGDYFGEMALLDGAPRSATVVATGELHVMRLPRRAFLSLAEHEPAVALRMLGNLGSQIRRLEIRPAV